MNNIKSILIKKSFVRSNHKPINENYEVAKEFGDYVGLSTLLVLKLFKKYGKSQVLSIRSFLYDYPVDNRGKIGIAYWKLNQEVKSYIPLQELSSKTKLRSLVPKKTGVFSPLEHKNDIDMVCDS